jgi:aspartate carbamoyltransferase catalytic subunit
MDIIAIDDISTLDAIELFRDAEWFDTQKNALNGKVLCNLFYEPSTRTSASFYSAMSKQGGSVIPIDSVSYSSVTKGEDLEDTIRTVATYADIIVLRHPEVGSAKIAAEVSDVPVINAGDGNGEHPTQTLLDAYTIWKHYATPQDDSYRVFDALHITLMGDLKNGRTVHSLVKFLDRFPVYFHFVCPKEYMLPKDITDAMIGDWNHTEDLADHAEHTDVLYMTRVQKERGSDFEYGLTKENVELFKDDMIVMHPLPRNDELPKWFDDDPRAKYFEQMANGLVIRQSLLRTMLE